MADYPEKRASFYSAVVEPEPKSTSIQVSATEVPHVEAEPKSAGVQVNTTEIPYVERDDYVEAQRAPTSRTIPPAKTSTFKRLLHHFWLFEVGALTASVLGLVAILIILVCTDGKPVPKWTVTSHKYNKSASVTINSVISLFSTLVKSTVLIPVAAGLGELKWLWFSGKDRKITDVLVFDGAARGPLGATMMLWKLRKHFLPCLGAIVVIGSLTLDFAFQQLITYPLRATTISDEAIVPRANGYNSSVSLYHDYRTPDSSMIGAIYNGFYTDDKTLPVTPVCTTGNCTWPQVYSTIGVCSRCYDTTNLLKKTCSTYNAVLNDSTTQSNATTYPNVPYCTYALPSGQSIDGRSYSTPPAGSDLNYGWVPTTVVVSDQPASDQTYFGSGANFAVFSILRGTWEIGQNDGISGQHFNLLSANATECGLQWCVIKYGGNMEKNNFTEEVVDIWTDQNPNTSVFETSDGMYTTNGAIFTPPASWTNKSETSDNNLFLVDYSTEGAIASFFESLNRTGVYFESLDGTYQKGTNEYVNRLRFLDTDGMNRTFQNWAASMTRRMRLSAAPGADDARPEVRAIGTTLQDIPYVHVRWGWIGFPATVAGLSAVFLICTFVKAKQAGATMLWKGSGLATFYHPLPSEASEMLQEAAHAKHAEKIAENIRVRWQDTDGAGRFVLH